jgi:hypothetical protein
MKNLLAALSAGLLLAASPAESPSPTAEEKAAAARELAKAQDKAAANYKESKDKANKGSSSAGATAPGADHANDTPPAQYLTRKEAQTEMPMPGQANDHSSTARETVPSSR